MKRKYVIGFIPLFILLLCEIFFFRNVIISNLLIGDRGDGRLCTLIAEHWYQFFSGKEPFSQLRIFYPAESTVAYSDMLLGYGIIHTLLRAAGLNMFLAYKYTLILIHGLGTFSTYFLLHSKWKIRTEWSMIGTISFAFSNVYAYKFGHTQLNAIAFVPLLLIVVTYYFQYFNNRKKRNIAAYTVILLYALIMYTAWYIAFFCLLFLLIFFVVFLHDNGWKRAGIIIGRFLKNLGCDIIKYILLMLVVVISFGMLYLPVLKMSGGRSYIEVAAYLPEIMDLINVTANNLLLGGLIQKMGLNEGEMAVGYSLIFWILFVLLVVIKKRDKREESRQLDKICNCVVCTIIISLLLPLKLSSSGMSLWIFVYKLVPGAGSIRAVARYLFFLSFPMAVIIAIYGNNVFTAKLSIRKHLYLCTVIGMLLLVSNIYGNGVWAYWNEEDEKNFIDGVEFPPSDCNVFYIKDTSGNAEPAYIYQLDAFEIAARFGLKTINGYSGVTPSNWDGLWEVCGEEYKFSIDRWITDNHLENVYSYDKATNIWEKEKRNSRK